MYWPRKVRETGHNYRHYAFLCDDPPEKVSAAWEIVRAEHRNYQPAIVFHDDPRGFEVSIYAGENHTQLRKELEAAGLTLTTA